MHKLKWDTEINGVTLSDTVDEHELIASPRPVFYEELNLLGFDRYWKYPFSEEPLLWAIGRRYYHKGIWIAEAQGGDIFNPPRIVLTDKGRGLQLQPIDMGKVVGRNQDALFTLENEAIDFVEHVYKKYKDKVDFFTVAFSGGKDSQVVLDIVSRILPPEDYLVIFTDTTTEISFTYETVKRTEKQYKKKYPALRFYRAKPPKLAIEFWKEFGPPSRFHRWCCSVLKTVPFAKRVEEISTDMMSNHRNPQILVFEGIRAEESPRRSKFIEESTKGYRGKIAPGAKHYGIINARPITYWSSTEIYLYLFYRRLRLNSGYRYGLTRVGCSVCPFASEWSEFIVNKIDNGLVAGYLQFLQKYSESLGIADNEKIRQYIAHGQWKKRAGGRNVDTTGSMVQFSLSEAKLTSTMRNPKEDFLEWLKVVGDVLYRRKPDGTTTGELRVGRELFSFEVQRHRKEQIVTFDFVGSDLITRGKIKKVLYKATYCVHCGTCEIECPSGALRVAPRVMIDHTICLRCGNCLYFTEKGCIGAKSVDDGEAGGQGMKKKTGGIDRYSSFGMREPWLKDFLKFGDQWHSRNNLGNKQVMAMIHWLSEAELLDIKSKKLTMLAQIMQRLMIEEYQLCWQIIWANLYYNSRVVKWYLDHTEWGKTYTKNELKERIKETFPQFSSGTLNNAIDAIANMLANSPLGNELRVGAMEKRGKIIKRIKKFGTEDVHPWAVAYSLYKAAEHLGRRDFTLSELYKPEFEGGPYKLFGISREILEKILRGLQEDRDRPLRVDLMADLDNIYLRDDLSSLDIAKIAASRL